MYLDFTRRSDYISVFLSTFKCSWLLNKSLHKFLQKNKWSIFDVLHRKTSFFVAKWILIVKNDIESLLFGFYFAIVIIGLALDSIFCLNMSQLNLNNFWTDWATELGLDSKWAPFQAVSEYDIIALRFYNDMLVFEEKLQIRLFFYQNCILIKKNRL